MLFSFHKWIGIWFLLDTWKSNFKMYFCCYCSYLHLCSEIFTFFFNMKLSDKHFCVLGSITKHIPSPAVVRDLFSADNPCLSIAVVFHMLLSSQDPYMKIIRSHFTVSALLQIFLQLQSVSGSWFCRQF